MLRYFRSFFIATCCVGIFIPTALAATAISQVSVPTAEGQQEQIEPLLSEGLKVVLVRLTGNPNIESETGVAELLKTPKEFLENYKHQAEISQLSIAFDQHGIEQALTKLNIPFWTVNRPIIVSWWLVEEEGTPTLLSDSQKEIETLSQAAAKQGFPLRLPMVDLSELALVDKAVFDAENPVTILEASEKYTGNAILVAHSAQQEGKWLLKWQLWFSSKDKQPLAQGKIEASSFEALTAQLFEAINPPLSKVFIVKAGGEPQDFEITIKNIDFDRYVQVSKTLTLFNGKLLETSGSVVRYKVTADPIQLKAQLGLINLYEEAQAEPVQGNLVFKP